MTTYRNWMTGQIKEGVSGDILFADDDQLSPLPMLTGVAITMAVKSGGCFTRQRTADRCERVLDAISDRLVARGLVAEVRPGKRAETFGLYLSQADRAPVVVGSDC